MPISAGTIVARLGADTSDFQAKFLAAGKHLNTMGVGFEDLGRRSTREMMRVGMGMTQMARGIQTDGSNLGNVLEMMTFHVGSLTGALAPALVVGAATAGWQIGKLISNVTGLTAAIANAGPKLAEDVKGLWEDAEALENRRSATERLAKELHKTVPEEAKHTVELSKEISLWSLLGALLSGGAIPVMGQETKGREAGVKALAKFNEELLKEQVARRLAASTADSLVKSLKEEGKVHDDLIRQGNTASIQEAIHLEHLKAEDAALEKNIAAKIKRTEAEQAYQAFLKTGTPWFVDRLNKIEATRIAMLKLGEDTIKAYGMMTPDLAVTGLADIEKKIRAVSMAGADSHEVMAKMGPDILKAVEEADKMRMAVPNVVRDAADAIKAGNDLWLGDLMTGLSKMPNVADKAAVASSKELDEIGDKLKGSISGGFGKGAKEGVDFAKQQMDAWRRDIEATPIKLQFDIPDLQALIRAAISGRIPATGYSAP